MQCGAFVALYNIFRCSIFLCMWIHSLRNYSTYHRGLVLFKNYCNRKNTGTLIRLLFLGSVIRKYICCHCLMFGIRLMRSHHICVTPRKWVKLIIWQSRWNHRRNSNHRCFLGNVTTNGETSVFMKIIFKKGRLELLHSTKSVIYFTVVLILIVLWYLV